MRCVKPLVIGKDRRAHINVAFEPADAAFVQAAARGMPVTAWVRWAALHMADQVVKVDAEFRKARGV